MNAHPIHTTTSTTAVTRTDSDAAYLVVRNHFGQVLVLDGPDGPVLPSAVPESRRTLDQVLTDRTEQLTGVHSSVTGVLPSSGPDTPLLVTAIGNGRPLPGSRWVRPSEVAVLAGHQDTVA